MEITRNQIKHVKSLHRKKERMEQGLFIVEGRKSVFEALNAGMVPQMLFHYKELTEFQEFRQSQPVSSSEMERITALSNPSEALAVFKIPHPGPVPSKIDEPLLFFLDGIQDPGNLGTIIRIADWYGLHAIVCSNDCVDTYNSKTVQASMGSLFHLQVYRADAEEIALAIKSTHRFICADLEGTNLWDSPTVKQKPVLLAIGSEAHGLKPATLQLAEERITIPGGGRAESLNAAISAGLIASALLR
jgi:TrmH family RNA methyltransferase